MSKSFCSNCGINLSTHTNARYCPSCGEPIEANASRFSNPNITNTQTTHVHVHTGRGPFNKWITLLLLLFLGAFGGHKFYEGKIFLGILYLFTLGLFGIGLLFDFFIILFKPTEYYL